eukprot:389745_1
MMINVHWRSVAHDTLKLCIGFSPCDFAYYHRYLLWCHQKLIDPIHISCIDWPWNARIFGMHLASVEWLILIILCPDIPDDVFRSKQGSNSSTGWFGKSLRSERMFVN